MRPVLLLSVSLPLLLGGCGEKSSPEGSKSTIENQTTPSEEVKPQEPDTETKPADAVFVNPNLKYEIKGAAVTITGCDEKISGDLLIPATIEGKPVTNIGNFAFGGSENLTSITIPTSVSSIGNQAFVLCANLTSITIPDSVTSIGSGCFYYCNSLTSITIPDSITSIGEDAFAECSSLTNITIPDGVTRLGAGVFFRCTSLTNITIGSSVTSIEAKAFMECTSLTSITIPDSVTSIGTSAFAECSSLTSISIPDNVTSIGWWAFRDCSSLATVTFLGYAPEVVGEPFNASPATIYRKPEAKGWGDTIGGRPVKMISEKP